uniref:Xanthine/uracil/vitamin C permease n=2 Tax=Chaetoceros debilis TaxID=122233 RepID=A0A7S3QH40_9STRA
MLEKLNSSINASFIGRYFQMEERKTNFTTELAGATATFLTVAYILAVNPRILSTSGGPCKGDIFSPEYGQCMEDIKREFITSTALCSMVGCLLMGLVANLPIALAPGMGMNAYFTYSVVGWRGTGAVSYEAAVTAVAIEGALFFILAITGARFAIVKLIPEPVKVATPAGIGAFLAHLGLQTAEGLGLVVSDIATAVTLGACPAENRVPIVAYTEACKVDGMCNFSDAYTCDDLGGIMTSAPTWVGLLGLVMMAILLGYKSKFAFLAGIGFVTVISWFRNSAITYFADDDAGNDRFEYFKSVVRVEKLDMAFAPFTSDLAGIGLALFTFLYVDFLDTSGTLLGLANSMGIVDENGDFPGSKKAFSCDALATLVGAFFGMSPVTSYIESGAGVEIGSKTGLTAVICAFYFFISIFFAPIIASIPPWASGGALVIVGSLMAKGLVNVQWNRISHALPAFLTVMIMPLTYSIAYGLIAGISVYYIIEGTYLLLSYVGIKNPSAADEVIVDTEEKANDAEAELHFDDEKLSDRA